MKGKGILEMSVVTMGTIALVAFASKHSPTIASFTKSESPNGGFLSSLKHLFGL